jgi:hypothetical protein
MAYYSPAQVKRVLENHTQLEKKLYCRGFLISDYDKINLSDFPFYGNWSRKLIASVSGKRLYLYTHFQESGYICDNGESKLFLVGHAYNPYRMQSDENEILKTLSLELSKGEEFFWQCESELTGVFCIGYILNDKLVFSTDCAGMQLVYYGEIRNNVFVTSHSKIVADLFELKQDEYIVKLINDRFYHLKGTWLPGDLSPFKELKRTQPNCKFSYSFVTGDIGYQRYFPYEKIKIVEDYENTITEVAQIMSNNLKLIAQKWPNQRTAISVTGGRDSTATLSSAHEIYDSFKYFSYISNSDEEVDAIAAKKICDAIGVEHTIYKIPDESELYNDLEAYRIILECNAGCIGHNNMNDVKKRIYFDKVEDFDVEVKSWVSELGRCDAYYNYNTNRFPKKPKPGYWRCMWKFMLNPVLINKSNKIFKEYIDKFYSKEVTEIFDWTDLFYWEFSWSGGEGVFLTSEHRYSYDITIPYNNRRLLATIFTIPTEQRMKDCVPLGIIKNNDRRISDAKVYVKDVSHTDFRAFLLRIYLRLFSKI